ncbi:MAG: LacI family DNA-binding transcriptional regulator, partial [Solirubrobacterales bacterium]|nr:LacI family DNA-binding transcriptional regulator [Solirubrobacterales bacterium]
MAKRQSRATGRTGKPSIADVAAIANVSTQTVSRVLAGSENVRPATRTVVLDAIRQVDYHPNTAARRLASGRTRTIGLVTVDTVAHSRSAIAHGIADAARAADYEVATATVDRLAPLFVARAIRQLVSQGIDGLVLAVPMRTPDQSALEVLETLPTVALAGEPAHYYDLIAV